MKQFWIIFSYQYKKQVLSKSYMILTGIISVLMIGVIVLSMLLGITDKKGTIEVIDRVGIFKNITECSNELEYTTIRLGQDQEDTLLVEEIREDGNKAIIIFEYDNDKKIQMHILDNYIVEDNDLQRIKNYADHLYKASLVSQLNLTQEEKDTLTYSIESSIEQVDTVFETYYLVTYVMILFIVLCIMMYSASVAGEISYAKTNRVMELLITSASARAIFLGITLAIGLVGLTQVLIIVAVTSLGIMTIQPGIIIIGALAIDFSIFTIDKILVYITFFFLGYLFYAILDAGTGALVSKNEDVAIVMLPIQLLSTVQLFVAMWAISSPGNVIVKILSYVPFTSPATMFVRYMIDAVGLESVCIALIILIITLVFSAMICSNIFKKGILYYGNLKDIKRLF